jgi:serine protease inhibitor
MTTLLFLLKKTVYLSKLKRLREMKKITLLLLFCITIILMPSCEKEESEITEPKVIELSERQKNIVISNNQFAFSLLQKVSESEDASKNIMISPLSINLALAMTTNGAKENTLSQMLETLGFQDFEMEEFNEFFLLLVEALLELDNQVDLSIANSIFYRNTFDVLQSFLDINQEYYNAEISALDFNSPDAVTTINNWVADNTNNKITEIIDQIDSDVVMYLINAIYFYGNWKYEFDKSQTQDANFYLANGSTVNVPMMKMEANLKYSSAGNIQIVELPYGRGNYVMNLILPEYDQSVNDLLANLDADTWRQWTNSFYETETILSLPKFSFEYEKGMKDILISLGMTDIFDENLADLSGINAIEKLWVSRVIHKTYIDVNEEGTEAAAVTAAEVVTESAPQQLHLNFDRPFVFIISETSTESVLFSGVVANPQ